MALDAKAIASQMLTAALPILTKGGQEVKQFAEAEIQKISQTMAEISQQVEQGQINQEQAAILLNMQTTASQNVLLAINGMTLVTAEQAINAALRIVATAVNTAVKFPLIP